MLKVVGLEGGPCGGKSTAAEYISDNARAFDIETVLVPEPATIQLAQLAEKGLTYDDIKQDPYEHLQFQTEILRVVDRSIKRCRQIHATRKSDMLVIIDRPDIGAYVTGELYRQAYSSIGYSSPPFYTQVDTLLYFPTIAKRSAKLYESLRGGNAQRYESAEQAIATCDENFNAVKDHPNLWLMDEEVFERTLRYAANIALRGFGQAAVLQEAY